MTQRDTETRTGLSRRGVAAALGVPLLTSACATPKRLGAVPVGLTGDAQPVIPNARFFPDRDPEPFVGEMAVGCAKAAWLKQTGYTVPLPAVAFLSISGGGDGAFGAGLLVGATKHSEFDKSYMRPLFELARSRAARGYVRDKYAPSQAVRAP